VATFAELVDAVSAGYLTFTGDATVLFQRGQLKRAEHQQQRRVVFVRPGGTVTPSTRAGSSDIGGNRVRMVKRRDERVFAYIHAESEDAAEALLDNLIVVCEQQFGTGFQPGTYEWVTESEEAAHLKKYTEHIRLQMTWRKPVLDGAEPLTQIETQAHVCSLGEGDFDPADFMASDFLAAGGEAA
jgi:hypothetical protein